MRFPTLGRSAAAEITSQFGATPAWLVSLIVLAVALAAALALHELGARLVRRATRRRDVFWRELMVRIRRPSRVAVLLLAAALASNLIPISERAGAMLRHALLIGFIVLVGWAVLTAMDIASAIYMRRFRVDVSDNLAARKHLTQIRILRRVATVLVVILTAGFALMTISGVREWGVSLLAAGGAAGIIVGLALQPVLSNLFAGIQIAMTQPIRIDDAVVVAGETGHIEEINATYVVVRLWDERRLVVPLTEFLQKPFENWTRQTSSLLGSAMVQVDYTAPVDLIRGRFEEIVRASPLWDGRVVKLHVTELRERTMELRCLVSAANSGDAFDLRAEVREKLIAFLQAEHPYALPRDRQLTYDADEDQLRRPAPGSEMRRRADA